MVDFISPLINSSEIDLSTIIPSVGTTEAAYAGVFNWGPVDSIRIVTNERELVRFFRKPNDTNYVDFFVCANFLSYGNNLKVVRVGQYTSNNATTGTDQLVIANEHLYDNVTITSSMGVAAARYPGTLGNSLQISYCASANGFSSNMAYTANTTNNSNIIVFNGNPANDVLRPLQVGDIVSVSNSAGVVANAQVLVINGTTVSTDTIFNSNNNNSPVVGLWQYAYKFDGPPDTSDYTLNQLGSNDEMHIVIVDQDGLFTGYQGRILERFPYVSKASDAKHLPNSGKSIYYKNVLNRRSKYVWWLNHPTNVSASWGGLAANTAFSKGSHVYNYSFIGGQDPTAVTQDRINSYIKNFGNKEAVDVSLLIAGPADTTLAAQLKTLAESRGDCVAFVSPRQSDVVNLPGQEAFNCLNYQSQIGSSSYVFMDNNWKYMYDRYNDTYRWIPCNGDTAGLCARTDYERDAWWSPAGFNRGQLNGVTRLAWNANQAERDMLYQKGINSIVTFPGDGTILYGDKTLQQKPSAFNRINVRRLFIILEKAISTASKYTLFEFNDAFTRSQFVSMVTPFLQDIQGRRGIYDFRVVCDESNNTPEVIDNNEFVGTILVQPAKSINYIQLNFVATRTGVDFSTINL